MRSNNSGCLTGIVAGFSRIMLLMIWLARPLLMNATFSSVIMPCLGFLFLPFTTLMYVLLKQGVGTIQGLDWLWLFLAVLLDIASIGAAGAANRNRIPQGYPGSYAENEYVAPAPAQPGAATPPAPAARPSRVRRPRPQETSSRRLSRNKLSTQGADGVSALAKGRPESQLLPRSCQAGAAILIWRFTIKSMWYALRHVNAKDTP